MSATAHVTFGVWLQAESSPRAGDTSCPRLSCWVLEEALGGCQH